MKKCPYCGRGSWDTAAQCSECGTALATEANDGQTTRPNARQIPSRPVAGERMLRGALWWIGGIFAAVLAGFVEAGSPSGSGYLFAWSAFVLGAREFFRALNSRKYRRGGEGDAYGALAYAARLETQGRVQAALFIYQRIAENYPATDTGRDAQKSIESRQAILGGNLQQNVELN